MISRFSAWRHEASTIKNRMINHNVLTAGRMANNNPKRYKTPYKLRQDLGKVSLLNFWKIRRSSELPDVFYICEIYKFRQNPKFRTNLGLGIFFLCLEYKLFFGSKSYGWTFGGHV